MQKLIWQALEPSKHALALLAFKEVKFDTPVSFSDMKSTLVTRREIEKC